MQRFTIAQKMKSVEFNLYKKDFKVAKNKSCLGRVLRTIVIIVIVFSIQWIFPNNEIYNPFLFLIIVLLLMFISDKFIRKLYSDWPKKKNFIGTIVFNENNIIINKNVNTKSIKEFRMDELKEIVLFYDHYTGFANNSRDIQRNGNALLYLESNNEKTFVFKFNINRKTQYKVFLEICDLYKTVSPYFKTYIPDDIGHILKPDLSKRIIYTSK